MWHCCYVARQVVLRKGRGREERVDASQVSFSCQSSAAARREGGKEEGRGRSH